jgi:hypothetical protein
MAVLYSNNFDAEVNGALTGWVQQGGGQFVVSNLNDAGGTPVQGTKHFGQNSENYASRWEGGGVLTNQALRIAQKFSANGSSVGALLRAQTTLADRGVRMFYNASGGNLRGSIIVRDNGAVSSNNSAYDIPVVVGDIVHLEASVVGSAFELRIWTNSNPRPATATVSHTSAFWGTGYPALIKCGSPFEFSACDQLVITDAAGGEDFFYPPGGVLSGAVVLEGVTLSGSFQGVAAGLFSGAVNLDGVSVSGSFGTNPGTLTSEPLRTNNGTLLANTALAHVSVYSDTTGVLVLRRTNVVTDASGVFALSDPAIGSGTTYRIDWETSGGHRRMPRKLAS